MYCWACLVTNTLKAHAQRKLFSFEKLSQERSVTTNDQILYKTVKGMYVGIILLKRCQIETIIPILFSNFIFFLKFIQYS